MLKKLLSRVLFTRRSAEMKLNSAGQFQPVVRSIFLRTIGGQADLEQFEPEDSLNFEIILEVFVGVDGLEGSDCFDVTVCTPKSILENLKESDHMIGHGMLIVPRYSYARIVEHIKSYVKMCSGDTIDDVYRRVGLLGEWEDEWEIKRRRK